MAYGFKTFTENGYAQIDGENLQLKVVASGSVVPANESSLYSGKNDPGGRYASWDGPVAANIALPSGVLPIDVFLFGKPSNDNQNIKMFACEIFTYNTYVGGAWVPNHAFRIFAPEWVDWGSNTIDYKVCVVNNDLDETQTQGLEVFNSSGDLGFSSRRVNFKGEQFATGTPDRNMSSTGSTDAGSTVIGPLYMDKPTEKLDYYCLLNGTASYSGWQIVTGGGIYNNSYIYNAGSRGMSWYRPFLYFYYGSGPYVKMYSDYSQSDDYGSYFGNQVNLASTRGILIGTFV